MTNAEDYLDGLLNSVQNARDDVKNAEIMAEENRKQREEQRNKIKPDDDFLEASGLNNYSFEPSSHENLRKAFSEDDFLRSFEEELGINDMEADSFIRDFENELLRDEMMVDEEDYETHESEDEAEELQVEDDSSEGIVADSDMSFLDNIESIVSQAKEQIEQGELPDDLPDIGADFSEETESEQEMDVENDAEDELSPLAGFEPDEMDALFEDAPIGDPGENLLENYAALTEAEAETAEEAQEAVETEEMPEMLDENDEDADLMDLLSGDADLGDIGDLLQADDDNIELEESQAEFDAQADAEGNADDLLAGFSDDEETGETNQASGIKGLIGKIKSIFSKKDKSNEDQVLDLTDTKEENLTEENLEILKSLDEAEAEGNAKEKKKKEKKEKKKKEKEEKEPKEKKPKKPKKEKVKKEKKPDNSPKIPTKFILIFVLFGASLVMLITIGQRILGYRMLMSSARSAYEKEEYFKAYESVIGLDLDDSDVEFFKKTRLLGDLQKRYQEYNVFVGNQKYTLALDSLLIGVGRYDENYEEAKELGIADEYQKYGEALVQLLSDQFGVSKEDALAMYKLNREDYSIRLDQIIEELELN